MTRTNSEKETVINFNEEDKTASIYTFNKPLIRKLNQLTAERPQECVIERTGPDESVTYTVPKRWVKVRPPVSRVLTEEQKRAGAERLAKARANRTDTTP